MYAAIDTILEPQTTTSVCLGHFTSTTQVSLITLKTDRLELYEWRHGRLVLLHRHQLAAPCLSAHRVSNLLTDRRDGLLLSFESSQYSTIAFDLDLHMFSTVSLHQYNEERMGKEGQEALTVEQVEGRVRSWAAVEPRGRCAVVRVRRDHFAVVPFERLDDHDTQGNDDERLPSWLVKFTQVDSRLSSSGVTDWCFLEGYQEPTLALLTSPKPAWSGRLSTNQRDTMAFAILTLDLRNQTISVIHYQDRLPNDLLALFPCSKPVGGCFAVGVSSSVHLEQGSPGCGMAVNGFACKLSDYRFLPILDPLEITLESSWMVQVGKESFWLIMADGSRLSLKVTKGSRFVNNMVASRLAVEEDHQPVVCSDSFEGFLVVGSDCGDTILYHHQSESNMVQPQSVTSQSTNNTTFDENDLYLAEMELEERQRTATDKHTQFTVVDRLASVGSVNDITVSLGNNHVNVERPVNARSPRQFVAVIGRGPSTNGIAVIAPHLPLVESARFPVPGATALFVVGSEYLLVSTPHSTLVLKMAMAASALEEVEESDYYLEGATLAAAALLNGLHVQVYSSGIRLLEGVKMVHEEGFGSSRCLKARCFADCIAVIDNRLVDRIYAVDSTAGLKTLFEGKDCVLMGLFGEGEQTLYYRLSRQGLFSIHNQDTIIFQSSMLGLLPHLLTSEVQQSTDTIVLPEHIAVVMKSGVVYLVVAVKGQLAIYTGNTHSGTFRFIKTESRMMRVGGLAPPIHIQNNLVVPIITGNKMWSVLIGPRGYPRIMPILGNFQNVASLDNQGQLLFVDRSSRVRLVSVDTRFDLDRADCSVMIRRFNTLLQPYKIVYLPLVNAFVVTNRQSAQFSLPSDDYSADADHPEFEYPKSAPTPQRHSYSVSILSPISWTLTDSFEVASQAGCSEYDVVVDCKVCTLSTKSHQSGRKPFVVVGLVGQKGEDRPVRGRCLVVDVTEVVPEPGKPETNRRLRVLCSADMKTTVGVVCELKGAVLVSQGARIIVHAFENDDSLQGCAFVDSAIFSSKAASLDGLFALGDVQRGVSMYAYQEEPPRIVQVGRAMDALTSRQSITAIEFLINSTPTPDNTTDDAVLIASGDQLGNLYLHSYSPKHGKSLGGNKLVLRGVTRLPSAIQKMQRLVDKVFMLMADGSLSSLSSLPHTDYKRLSAMQSHLSRVIPALGGPGWKHARQPRLPTFPLDGMPPMPRAVVDRQVVGAMVGVVSGVQARLLAMRAMVDFEAIKSDLEPAI